MNDSITDVMIHTRKRLSDVEFDELAAKVYAEEGIVSLSRNVHTPRFLMVVYNAAKIGAGHILQTVTGQGYRAALVGL